jgi:hypothetical protein
MDAKEGEQTFDLLKEIHGGWTSIAVSDRRSSFRAASTTLSTRSCPENLEHDSTTTASLRKL